MNKFRTTAIPGCAALLLTTYSCAGFIIPPPAFRSTVVRQPNRMAVGTCIDSSTSLSDSSSNTVSPFGIDDKNKVDLLKVKKGQSYSKRFRREGGEVAPAVTVPKRSFDTDLQDLLGLDSNSLQYEYNLTTAELF
eukprot:CAMPEP_0178536092 /NCGR_PEP_ID=MMETSP0696-20121128/35896_1 /TAXON_ID=265572 /ORGANISM="Extubocellulus spinifer, Strain CCMP396" /LENGTH=134 /DNA_ID=CAMNT_0020168279 /DNA_START=123 /DNA_END=525 /DNA_ORIENTATION=-